MDIRKLQRAIVDGLEDVKAQDIAVFNTEALSPLFERVIIASGTSNRQTKALASSVRETVKARGLPVLRTEGEDNGEWIIVDCGAAVAHIMQPTVREYYRLEEIWGGKAVRMKRAEAQSGLVKASEPVAQAPATAQRPARKSAAGTLPAGKAPAGRSGARTTTARKSAVAKTAAPKSAVVKTTARKSAVVKTTARKSTVVKTTARKSTVVKTTASKTAAAKAPARQAMAGKTAARKTASPRAPVRKATARKPSL